MTYTVSQALVSDAEVIADFNQRMALETEDKSLAWDIILPGVKTMLTDHSLGFYLVARNEADSVIGCLGITYEWSDWRNSLFWWIQSVYVAKENRNQGVFSGMYDAVKAQAESESNVCGIRLYVERDNETAKRTYLRLGMIETDYRIMEETF